MISFCWYLILQRLDHHLAHLLLSLHLRDFLNYYPCLPLSHLLLGLFPHLLVSQELSETRRQPGSLNLVNTRAKLFALYANDFI
jgi:hypothetical protein